MKTNERTEQKKTLLHGEIVFRSWQMGLEIIDLKYKNRINIDRLKLKIEWRRIKMIECE